MATEASHPLSGDVHEDLAGQQVIGSAGRHQMNEAAHLIPPNEQFFRDPGPSPLPAGYMYTPPEQMEDSFSKSTETAAAVQWTTTVSRMTAGPSPPVSPESRSLPSFSSATSFLSRDAPLYSSQARNDSSHSDAPLFATSPDHEAPRRLSSPSPITPDPNRNVGGLIGPSYNLPFMPAPITEYWHSCLDQVRRYRAAAHRELPKPTRSSVADRDAVSRRQLDSLRPKLAGVTKSRSPLKRAAQPKAPAAASSPTKAATPSRRSTPKTRTLQDFHDEAFPSDRSSAKHKRAAPSKKSASKEEDVRWQEIPDYSPPTESLKNAPKALKAIWGKGEPIDISQDPDVEYLSDAEYTVAGELRIHAQAYLANRRRMFGKRLLCLKQGKNFTKTSAQNACNIDVNKASKLWEAYERIGWFDDKWFTPKWDHVAAEDLKQFDEQKK